MPGNHCKRTDAFLHQNSAYSQQEEITDRMHSASKTSLTELLRL